MLFTMESAMSNNIPPAVLLQRIAKEKKVPKARPRAKPLLFVEESALSTRYCEIVITLIGARPFNKNIHKLARFNPNLEI